MDKLLHTSLYRAILKSLNRKATSEKRLQTYFFEFANEITIICNNTEYLSVLHTLNYTQIQFQYFPTFQKSSKQEELQKYRQNNQPLVLS